MATAFPVGSLVDRSTRFTSSRPTGLFGVVCDENDSCKRWEVLDSFALWLRYSVYGSKIQASFGLGSLSDNTAELTQLNFNMPMPRTKVKSLGEPDDLWVTLLVLVQVESQALPETVKMIAETSIERWHLGLTFESDLSDWAYCCVHSNPRP